MTNLKSAEEFAMAHGNVHYFPSYEIVINSDPRKAWTADGRHPEPAIGHHIMDLFLKTHAGGA